jgi:hypothetical protein
MFPTYNKKIAKRAEFIIEIAQRMAEKIDAEFDTLSASCAVEDIRLNFAGYEEPGYTTPEHGIVATGNWNSFRVWDGKANKYQEKVYYLRKRVGDLFEKMGIPCEWSDEWTECSECYALIRTSPDCYSWLPSYISGEYGYTCHTCVLKDPESYLKELEDSESNAITLDIDPCDHGYNLIDDSFETGWHPGQTDDPKKVAKELRDKGVSRFLFKITGQGQFDTKWAVYVHQEEVELLEEKKDISADDDSNEEHLDG